MRRPLSDQLRRRHSWRPRHRPTRCRHNAVTLRSLPCGTARLLCVSARSTFTGHGRRVRPCPRFAPPTSTRPCPRKQNALRDLHAPDRRQDAARRAHARRLRLALPLARLGGVPDDALRTRLRADPVPRVARAELLHEQPRQGARRSPPASSGRVVADRSTTCPARTTGRRCATRPRSASRRARRSRASGAICCSATPTTSPTRRPSARSVDGSTTVAGGAACAPPFVAGSTGATRAGPPAPSASFRTTARRASAPTRRAPRHGGRRCRRRPTSRRRRTADPPGRPFGAEQRFAEPAPRGAAVERATPSRSRSRRRSL